jgi:hypothetical protein
MTASEIAPLITSCATLLGVIINGFISARNGRKLNTVHTAVNGKMEQLIKEVRIASYAQGVKAQKDTDVDGLPIHDHPAGD